MGPIEKEKNECTQDILGWIPEVIFQNIELVENGLEKENINNDS